MIKKLIKIEDLKDLLLENSQNKNEEFKRLFHGRGNFYSDFNYLTVDSIDKILFVVCDRENCRLIK